MRLYELEQKYKIFVDLDGVLSDFTKGVERFFDEPHDEDRYEADAKYRKRMWDAIREYSQNGGELWYELELMPDAMILWGYVKKHDPEILSATGDPKYGAGNQKLRWVKENVDPTVKVNLVRKAADKQQHADENHILIDDKAKAIDPWKAAGGIGILHTSAANTIQQLKKLGL